MAEGEMAEGEMTDWRGAGPRGGEGRPVVLRWRLGGSCIYPQLNRPAWRRAPSCNYPSCIRARAQTNNLLAALLPGLALPGLAVLPCLASLECSMEARFSPTSSEEEAGSESSPVDGQSSSYRSSGRLRSSLSSPKTPKQWRHRGTE